MSHPDDPFTNDSLRRLGEWPPDTEPGTARALWLVRERVPEPAGHPEGRSALPQPRRQVRSLRLRIDVLDVEPRVWRVLDVRSDVTMALLHQYLGAAVGWSGGHLHRFWLGSELWKSPFLHDSGDSEDDDTMSSSGAEQDVVVDQVLREVGDELVYTYDFGDEWNHRIVVESVNPARADALPAVIVAGENAGPLEDAGGPWSYAELVAWHRGDGEIDDERRAWLPEGWDPEEFDLAGTAEAMSTVGLSFDELVERIREPEVATSGAPAPAHPEAPVLVGAPPTGRAPRRDVSTGAPSAEQQMPRCAELRALQLELAPQDIPLLAEWEAAARFADGDSVGIDDDARYLLQPWRVLLEQAEPDGIELTAAGWIRPATVRAVVQGARLRTSGGSGSRESTLTPLRNLRGVVMRAKLLRRSKGRLVLTKAGREALAKEALLWRRVARSAFCEAPDEFARHVHVLSALVLAAGDDPQGRRRDLAAMMTRAGWARDGGPITARDVADAGALYRGRLRVLCDRGEGRLDPEDDSTPSVLRHFVAGSGSLVRKPEETPPVIRRLAWQALHS